ncbi:MAG: KH domain-containing protein [Anaerolineae bacterium]
MPNQNENLDVSGKTVDEAIEQGLAQLGLTREQVEIEVLSEGKRGLFGLGAEEATVRFTVKSVAPPAVDVPAVADDAAGDEPQPEPSPQPEAEAAPLPAVGAPAPEDEDPAVTSARIHLETLLQHMGIEATVETRAAPELVEGGEEAPIVLDIQGKDLGILIGRRSETLQALQYLVRLMASKDAGSWQRIVVDVESYRSRRRQSLQKMARRMAERAAANQERVVLESMSAYERRIIHLTLRDHPAVMTRSIGQDNNRKVTIIPK